MALTPDELKKLSDPNRVTNHNIFPEKEFTTDFCDDRIDIETIEVGKPIDEIGKPIDPPSSSSTTIIIDECVCCECCDTANLNVRFEHVSNNVTSPPNCIAGADTEGVPYDYLTDDNGETLYSETGEPWALKVILEVPSSDSVCRSGIMTQAMYDNFIVGDIPNPIMPQQLIVEPGEKVYVLSIPVNECVPEEPVPTENVSVVTFPL